eukprot:NODE_4088_length_1233_cov_38.753153_g1755_i1.p1 GENE.NODE_4088_length_1233_cov_38.753153_g1755_i1~~NODE_4088_length_1233_cov_38.753153_g1755_i1.p1  ORF type:complete len:301 (-),score=99.36 NODE_4088_length_1233_cov_38.753153_g1755_i1:329-1195(-)
MLVSGKAPSDDMAIAEADHSALKQENQLLQEDNEELRMENGELEKEADTLREQLEQKDFVSDDEVQLLGQTVGMGNNSKELNSLIGAANVNELNKNELIPVLVKELKAKIQAIGTCLASKGLTKEEIKERELEWENMREGQKKRALALAAKNIAALKEANPAKAKQIISLWAPRYGGEDKLDKELSKHKPTPAEIDAASIWEELDIFGTGMDSEEAAQKQDERDKIKAKERAERLVKEKKDKEEAEAKAKKEKEEKEKKEEKKEDKKEDKKEEKKEEKKESSESKKSD